MCNIFKVKNKDTRKTVFTSCFRVSIPDFEQVNVRCDINSRTFASEKIFYTSMLTCEQEKNYFMLINLIKNFHFVTCTAVLKSMYSYKNLSSGLLFKLIDWFLRGTLASNSLGSSSAKWKCLKWESDPGPLASKI